MDKVKKYFKDYYVVLIAIALIIVDQLTKKLAEAKLQVDTPVYIIKDLFSWRLVYNSGAAWSMLSGHQFLLASISFISSALLLYFIHRYRHNHYFQLILALILAGAFGNGIDRLFYNGLVVDFIDFNFFYIINRHFPIFNFADMCITVGGFLLITYLVYNDFIKKKVE